MCPTIFPPNSGSNFATRESNSFRLFHSFRQELLSYTSRLFRNSFGGKCNIRPPGNLCRSIVVVYLLFQIDILLQVGGKKRSFGHNRRRSTKKTRRQRALLEYKTNIHDANQLHRALQISTHTNIVQSLWIYVPQSVPTKLHPIRQRIYEYLADPTIPFENRRFLVLFETSCSSIFFSPKNHIHSGRNIYTTKPKSTNRIANTNKDNSLFGAEYNTTNDIELDEPLSERSILQTLQGKQRDTTHTSNHSKLLQQKSEYTSAPHPHAFSTSNQKHSRSEKSTNNYDSLFEVEYNQLYEISPANTEDKTTTQTNHI